MRLSRLMLRVPAVVFALPLLFALGTTGCNQLSKVGKTPGKRTLKCETTINVNPAHGVDKDAVYVCEDPGFNKVSWIAPQGVTFTIQFPTNCPFNSCSTSITDSTPQTVAAQPADLTVYKYSIEIKTASGTHTFDPHVVGGGGYGN